MREILFKAKRRFGDNWIVGSLISGNEYDGDYVAICIAGVFYEVIPETVCQYTGLRDRNYRRIFEGDILSYNDKPPTPDYVVTSGKLRIMYRLKFTDRIGTELYEFSLPEFEHLVITGNIHDTTEETE